VTAPIPAVRAAAASHVGLVRPFNEDAMLTTDTVWAVADGLGGHRAGDVASALAVAALERLARDPRRGSAQITAAVRDACASIAADTDPGREGMATTLSALVAGADGKLRTANIGDSRVYRLREGRLRQLTVDHSEVQQLLDAGLLDAWQARHYPRRNVITRVVNARLDTVPDIRTFTPRSGDCYLLCTDGLHGFVDDATIAGFLRCDDPEIAAAGLIEAALAVGGKDNVTVVVAGIEVA
jgi:PPM family protein phosphatase